jgi:hypothetical protein
MNDPYIGVLPQVNPVSPSSPGIFSESLLDF